MVGGDYSQEEKAHTFGGFMTQQSSIIICLFHSLKRMGWFTILVINK